MRPRAQPPKRGFEMREILPHSDVTDGIDLNGRAPNAVARKRPDSPSFGGSLKNYRPADALSAGMMFARQTLSKPSI
jgi:hypothetical protein